MRHISNSGSSLYYMMSIYEYSILCFDAWDPISKWIFWQFTKDTPPKLKGFPSPVLSRSEKITCWATNGKARIYTRRFVHLNTYSIRWSILDVVGMTWNPQARLSWWCFRVGTRISKVNLWKRTINRLAWIKKARLKWSVCWGDRGTWTHVASLAGYGINTRICSKYCTLGIQQKWIVGRFAM